MLNGESVTLEDMMNCREQRSFIQQNFINKYHCPIISFCMNIPGPVKTTPEIKKVFEDCKIIILEKLKSENIKILEKTEIHQKTGDELILSVDADAHILKQYMQEIEETHVLGRLFDIDIIDINNQKLSRNTFRKCLICDRQAQECARSRSHTIEEMQNKIQELIIDYL